jgi:SEC-C motif
VASASRVEYNGGVLLNARSLTAMAKPGRNDPCPCGSGNKYKKCCLPKEEGVEREQLAKGEARRAENAAAHRSPPLRDVKAAIAAILSSADDADEDELTVASNAAADLVRAGKLDEAGRLPATSRRGSPKSTTATTASAWCMRPVVKTDRPPTAIGR